MRVSGVEGLTGARPGAIRLSEGIAREGHPMGVCEQWGTGVDLWPGVPAWDQGAGPGVPEGTSHGECWHGPPQDGATHYAVRGVAVAPRAHAKCDGGVDTVHTSTRVALQQLAGG